MSAHPKSLALQLIDELWNQKTPTLIETLYAVHCVLHTPDGALHGLTGATQLYTAYTTAFPDMRFTVEDVVAEGETVVIRYIFAGTHQGALRGIAATGKPVSVAGMVLLRFAEGKVVEQRGVWDSLSLMQQLGVVSVVGESAKDEAVRRRQVP
jgi:steroid delta-isomerase-like uncharacterized protein